MKTINYTKASNLSNINLNSIYDDLGSVINEIDKNIINIINTEAPLTLNTFKARFREIFNVKKISGKALDILMDRVNKLGFIFTEEIYDIVLWPKTGPFKIDYLRINSDRLIYDIPKPELKNLANSFNLSGEELYRKILEYFNLEVLTEKARNYLEFIEE